MDQTSLAALRERAIHGLVAPHNEVHRGVVAAAAAGGKDVLTVARAAASDRVTRRKAEELLGIGSRVTVEQGRSLSLIHGLKERRVFGQTELSRVAVEHGEVLIDFAAGLEDAASLIDLRGRGLGAGNALVERTPVHGRKTSADDHAVTRGQVAFLEHAILKDFVALGEEFGNDRNAAIGIGALRPIGEGEIGGRNSSD